MKEQRKKTKEEERVWTSRRNMVKNVEKQIK